MSHFESPNPLRDGAGESAPLMSKQLALEKVKGNRCTVHLYKATIATGTDIVDGLRDQLLAGACFSLDQDGGTRRRHAFDLFEYRLQSGTVAYDPFEAALLPILIA
jgi:hypothetical protein